MDIAFEDEKLRSVCLKRGRSVAVLGPNVAHELVKRLADVKAADTADDLIVGARIMADDSGEAIHVALASGFELILVANHVRNPIAASGKIDWKKVVRVKVTGISRVGLT